MDLKKAIKHQELKDLMVKKQRNGHHELALEIGLEALKISEEWQIYRDMGCSSLKLGKFKDAIKFFKQQLKLKDAGVLQNLWAYKNLIDAQCRTKDYQAAMKTCEKLKIFNLNSQNIQEVTL
jgi:tetratricopeptide (TPR) repeat protein